MSASSITRWIGIVLLGLPLYGALTFFSSLNPQPDPNTQNLSLMAAGYTNTAIASRLYLSPKTVRNYVSNIFTSYRYRTTPRPLSVRGRQGSGKTGDSGPVGPSSGPESLARQSFERPGIWPLRKASTKRRWSSRAISE